MINRHTFFSLALCGCLIGCGEVTVEEAKPRVTEQNERIREQSGTFHGNPKGFVLYSTRDAEEGAVADDNQADGAKAGAVPGASANSFLWQASLESLDFMPLAQADRSGGVIITDWFAPSETPDERFKVTVYILDSELRADALKVTVFRQIDDPKGWVDAPVTKGTASGLEDNILTRARELRLTLAGDASQS